MAEVTIYSTTVCPYCVRAKQLLERKGVAYKEINLSKEAPEVRVELMQRTNHRTVPQIFINDQLLVVLTNCMRLIVKANLTNYWHNFHLFLRIKS